MMLIPLGNKAGLELYAKVDDDDFEMLSAYRWHRNNSGRAARSQHYTSSNGRDTCRTILMHRVVARTPEDAMTDHINGDPLDNRKENLRACTRSENGMNRSPPVDGHCIGVNRRNDGAGWKAFITVRKKRIYLGKFATYDAAVAARKAAEPLYFGEFARKTTS